ncbi:hypothetical protein K1719_020354 [Acacia pycnantha]|nr:hypothetical protein K1719_020354 [Acacia pycnantha]
MNTTCIKSEENKRMEITQTPITALVVEEEVTGGRPKKKGKRTKKIFKRMGKWFKHDGNWLEEMRGNLSLVATVIATMTFQVAINPPGGFIQQGLDNKRPLSCLEHYFEHNFKTCPGDAMLATLYPKPFRTIVRSIRWLVEWLVN